jgi:hypothetical protein
MPVGDEFERRLARRSRRHVVAFADKIISKISR